MTPRRRLPWGAADWFGTPRGGVSLPETARRIADEYGPALAMLAAETPVACGASLGSRPLAWCLVGDGVARCAPCGTEVEVRATLLRCPDCGCVASKPEWWSQ